MTIGGLIAGVVVAIGAGAVSRFTVQKEDASLAAFYLISLALGVLIVSMRGSSIDLMHVLFRHRAGAERRGAVADRRHRDRHARLPHHILARAGRRMPRPAVPALGQPLGTPVHFLFLGLVVLNLVGGFQALGTLLAVG